MKLHTISHLNKGREEEQRTKGMKRRRE